VKERLRSWLGRGVFGTGRANAAIGFALAAATALAAPVYFVLNHGPPMMRMRTALDDSLPFLPVFVIPYNSLYAYIFASLAIFLVIRTKVFQSAAAAFILALGTSYGFYALLQTEVPRPALTGTDPFTEMVRGVYEADNPYNAFPSLHTALSSILAIHWARLGRWPGIAAWAWTSLIIASTVLIKQHYLPDLAAGLALAAGASWLSGRLFRGRRSP
jgi:membrane-associated phospholipid phosphatase